MVYKNEVAEMLFNLPLLIFMQIIIGLPFQCAAITHNYAIASGLGVNRGIQYVF